MHTCIINNKKYIGRSCNVKKRFGLKGQGYLRKKKNGDYFQPAFAHAILKYGWENFTHKILLENLTLLEANKKEKEFIKEYETQNPKKGYNIQSGGSVQKDYKSYKIKMSERMKGENNPMYGRELTPEERYERGNARRGKPWTEDVKEKISKSNKKFYETHTHHRVGKKWSDEKKEFFRQMNLGREINSEWREKIGKGHSPYIYVCVETGKEYYSSGDAMRDTGIDKSSIRKAADGRQNVAGNLHWKMSLKEDFINSKWDKENTKEDI